MSVLGALALGCVPSADEELPRGGISVSFAPSPPTRGEPFVTTDGWTISIERVYLRASLQWARSESGRGGGEARLVDPNDPSCDLRVRGVPVGPVAIQSRMDLVVVPQVMNPDVESPCGVDVATQERFDAVADNVRPEEVDVSLPSYGPNIVLAGRAEKDGRTKRFELALVPASLPEPEPSEDAGVSDVPGERPADEARFQIVTVDADVATRATFGLRAEGLFRAADGDGELVFEDLASADSDDDGVVTAGEVAGVTVCPSEPTASVASRCVSLLDVLAARLLHIIDDAAQSPVATERVFASRACSPR